jgi:chemotaxis protein CheX
MLDTTFDCQIEQIVQSIFSSMLGMEIRRSEGSGSECSETVIGTIHIAGTQPISVVLGVTDEVASATAAAMLQLPIASASEDDKKDVVAELTNMIGGNLKSIMPSPSYLSLPTVVAGRDLGVQISGAEVIDDVLLDCEAGKLRVRLFSKI